MKRIFFFLFLTVIAPSLFAQSGGEIKGTIKDGTTNETIIGANVLIGPGKGAITDINGNYSIKVDSAGEYTLNVTYVGYDAQKLKIKVGGGNTSFANFLLQTQTLGEVEVVADVAKNRETPIAFSNVSSKQIQEELGTRDLPMVLNSTPGAYATQQGGGSGDSRVNIRGFDQRNVAVMVDGVPVNDMENGQVYWSNWDGLSDITKTMQVQRGLGASKLAIASVGGTINVITRGIDQKMGASIKQEVNSYGLYKTSFGINSGPLKGGWGVTLGGSRKWGNEWADGTYTNAWSYFVKVQKRYKKHLFTLSGNGAPQSHGQRYDMLPIGIYNKNFSDKLGINTDSIYRHTAYTTGLQGERGLAYNPNWGNINGGGGTSEGKPGFFSKSNQGDVFNERVNYFHKPQFNFSHFWTPTDKLTVSTVAYLSVGHGGGTALKNSVPKDSLTGLLSVQSTYDHNSSASAINPTYSTTEHAASNYLRTANNDHIWYGVISSWNYKATKNLSTLFGIDARSYKGSHYQSVYNLMGADYVLDFSDKNQAVGTYPGDPRLQSSMKRDGDKVGYYNDAKVHWGGLFAQAEYKKGNWSTFITASVSQTGYQRIDYFKNKDLVIDGNTFTQAVGYGDVFYYNGTNHITAASNSTVTVSQDTTFVTNGTNTQSILNAKSYTNQSAEARAATTNIKWFLGYTVKGGANYNITEHQNAFVNIGYLNMAPRMSIVFDNNNNLFSNIKNQQVYAAEAGYGIRDEKFAINVNAYYTLWRNKPTDYAPTVTTPDGTLTYNITGLDALHKGVEIDFVYKLMKNLQAEGVVSLGDWKTISSSTVYVTDNFTNAIVDTVDFSAKNVHVGNAAQTQVGGSLRYEFIKGFYIKPRFTFFGKNYANFDPTTLIGTNKDRESWKMPNYNLLDLYAGYDFNYLKLKFTLTASMLNVLNTLYLTDAKNGINYDATTALVYMGMSRRFSVGLRVAF
jgi:iron complex outermembrane receptor protein